MGNMNGSRNNKRFIFQILKSHEKHYANVGRLANTTLRHYSESSKLSRNSLRGRLSCIMLMLETQTNVCSMVSVWEF